MEFLEDDAVQRILVIAGGVLGLFAVYLGLAVASNRSVRRLAQSLRRRGRGERRPIEVRVRSPLLRWPWAVLALLLAAALSVGLLIWITRDLQ